MAKKVWIFLGVIFVLYVFTGCGQKQPAPQIDRKSEILRAEMERSNVKIEKPKHYVNVEKIARKYGKRAKIRAQKLDKFMKQLEHMSEWNKIVGINNFFNRLFMFTSDEKVWHESDYWASRMEFLGKGAGDCEDFVIAKYFSLKQLGVPISKLYFTYVKALKLNQAHMVLTYYKNPHEVPLVLGNLIWKILPATKRKDLEYVYSFNARNLYLAKKTGLGQIVPFGNARNKKWRELNLKIQRENLMLK